MTATPEVPRQGRHRTGVSAEINRLTVLAEAKLLAVQLDNYVAMFDQWLAEEMEADDARE
jgi:hypothetical protein